MKMQNRGITVKRQAVVDLGLVSTHKYDEFEIYTKENGTKLT
jgi:hypothetical protein